MGKSETDLYEKAQEESERAEELFGERDALKKQANEVKVNYQSSIDELKAEADDLAEKFKLVFQEASEAYESGDGALAKKLSIEGKEAQSECEVLNERVKDLIGKLQEELDELYAEADEKHEEAMICIQEAKQLRAEAKDKKRRRHIPYTSEPSKPHRSKVEPREHVDVYHYGKDAKKEGVTTHITDEGHVEWGKGADKIRRKKKH